MQHARPLALALLLLALPFPARAEEKASGPAEPAERVWLEIRSPSGGRVQRAPIALTEVRGVTGAGVPSDHDVALVIDLSSSTRLPSGVDVDADGRTGRSSERVTASNWSQGSPEELCDDPGDTIAAAELAAARRLLAMLDPERTRVALVAFGDRGHLEAPLESPRPGLLRALDVLDGKHGWYGGTSFSGALETAVQALGTTAQTGRERRRSALFLSDGYPTMPLPEPRPVEAALAAARSAADRRIRVFGFALGPEAVRGRRTLDQLTELTGGSLTALERPGDVLFHLPTVELSDVVAVEMENTTSGAAGRAVRLFADGTFDGFVPLVRGENRIRVRSKGAKGAAASEEIVVQYEPVQGTSREVEMETETLRRLLRDRTLEVELQNEMRRKRGDARRELEIRTETQK
jgi:hypothetical protein